MTLQRIIQTFSVVLFITLLWLAAFPLLSPVPVDMFLQMDPVAVLGTGLSARVFFSGFWTAGLVLVLSALLGRFFCGYICPMGATIDVTDRLIRPAGKSNRHTPLSTRIKQSFKQIKYQILLFILGAGLLGVSLVFLASPLSLITRFYGLVIFPVVSLFFDTGLVILRPVANYYDFTGLLYAQINQPRFDGQWFTIIFFIAVFVGAIWSRRFWCRYLCPAGAIFALCGCRPLWRRQVSDDCTQCGKCQKQCPMGAIEEDPLQTDLNECITCQTCVRICPVRAVSFSSWRLQPKSSSQSFSRGRRKLIWAGFSGMGAAMMTYTGLHHPTGDTAPGQVVPTYQMRPPGALPETDFLARCIRCGECMTACPTNTLQPVGLASGISAFFSPRILPRRGPCEPQCHVCGQVCPTGAIIPLVQEERIWAKVGTAYVIKHKCLAWEFNRKCLVCDEVCPYNAVDFKQVPGIEVAVPHVNEARCSGCGFCEHHCPVQAQAAILVEPMGALRLKSGSFRKKGREAGLELALRPKNADITGYDDTGEIMDFGDNGLPPGFSE